MSDVNVTIRTRRDQQVVAEQHVHNVWTDFGRMRLARIASLAARDPDVGMITGRVKYMGWGVGGQNAYSGDAGVVAALDIICPCPNAVVSTPGNTYNHRLPISPQILTLERPVVIGAYPDTPWPTYAGQLGPTPNDVYRYYTTVAPYQSGTTVSFISSVDGATANFTAYDTGPISISEAGLFLGDIQPWLPYQPAVAYVNFQPFDLLVGSTVEIIWDVRF